MNGPANVQFVPLNYRLLLVNTIALGWNCISPLLFELIATGYLSVVNAPPQTEQEKKDKLTILVE
jgi:Mpv17 / PMP22 family